MRFVKPGTRLRSLLSSACVLAVTAFFALRAQAASDLKIYLIDVEGGQATLFVTPAGQSMLIDTGWPGNEGRDADRILAAARLAGISKIDYVLLTHYHIDHSGGVPQLVERIPVGTFIDHGPNMETGRGPTQRVAEAYQKLLDTGKYKHIVAQAGDTIPIVGMQTTIISSDGKVIDHALPGAGRPNAACSVPDDKPVDETENAHSLGIIVNFGGLKILDLGDLTWDKEKLIMCPVNKLGKIDLLIVSHHGFNASSSHALIDGIQTRVALMDNGARKGGDVPVLDTIRHARGLEDLWQLHYSEAGGADHNTGVEHIANPDGPDAGNYLLVTATPKGSFTVFNSGNNKSKTYASKK